MHATKKLWTWLAIICLLSFTVLGWVGREIYLKAPPIAQVVDDAGSVIYTAEQVKYGQSAWLSAGGQQLGTVWGHGSYLAPDWSADWLHREAVALQDLFARKNFSKDYAQIEAGAKAHVDALVKTELRTNTYNADTNEVKLSAIRAEAVRTVASHYAGLFGNAEQYDKLREQYAMAPNSLPEATDRAALTGFFFWSSWAAAADRPGEVGLSYTSNWPHEPLIDNTPTAGAGIWSIASIILMIGAIAGMLFFHSLHKEEDDPVPPKNDPLFSLKATPSMKATKKYFLVVIGLILAQVGMGVITAHFAVEGSSFFGIPLANVLPFTVSRTIHTQFAVLWIATAWLATGLYIAPAISGAEPKFQKLGTDVLFYALLFIVVGSTATGWLGTLQHKGVDFSFWLGNQGLEFTSMGRIWQILLFVGLLFWAFLLGRGLWPALKKPSESRGIIAMVFLAALCIGGFYATSLTWGKGTHYSMIEYWRWWLVHLWVEGFFEVFATAVIAFLFTRLGLLASKSATVAVLFATIVFMAGGVLGTLHHLYFAGTPTAVLALGASFSALEVVPLAYIGFEAYRTSRLGHATPWMARYRWPIQFFVAVAFWNLVGAGLFGFLINPPLSLYWMQGLNLTPLHGHTALFGVYGMLGIGLVLFCLRGLRPGIVWNDRLLGTCFWSLNIGLALMALLTLLPIGTLQLLAAIDHGYAYARSAEFMHQPLVELLVWMRVPGDVIFSIGAVALTWFVMRLWIAPPRHEALPRGTQPTEV